MIEISMHAVDRMRERMKMNNAAMLRTAARALNSGVHPGDTRGALRRYLDSLLLKKRNCRIRVYGDIVYVFALREDLLVTVHQLPTKYRMKANRPTRRTK